MRRVMQNGLNGPRAASQSEQETGTSKTAFVTSENQHYHDSAAKAWAHVLMSGSTPILITGYNISSVSLVAAGMNTVSLTNGFSSAFYACIGSALTASGTGSGDDIIVTFGNLTTGGFNAFVKRADTGALTSFHLGFNIVVYAVSA